MWGDQAFHTSAVAAADEVLTRVFPSKVRRGHGTMFTSY